MVEVFLPADLTMWVQDLVHWNGHVYGLFHHYGDPRLPGLWRVNLENGEFETLRFVSGASECRLPLNSFDIGADGMRALFFCAEGCEATSCSSGEVRDAEAPLMPFQGAVEEEWRPAVDRGPRGSIEGWRYAMDQLDQPYGDGPGRFVLVRSEKRVRGRE